MEKHWETIPQGTGAVRGLLIAARAGAQLTSNGSSCPGEMGKHMEVLKGEWGIKYYPTVFFLFHCVLLIPWISVSSYSWQRSESVGGTHGAAAELVKQEKLPISGGKMKDSS